MDAPANFKFDVRIRARLLAKGLVTEAEVAKHLDALADLQPSADYIDLAQPALTSPEERERHAPAAVRPSAVVPRAATPAPVERSAPVSIPPAAAPVDDSWDDDDDDDDDEDDEDEAKVAPAGGDAGGDAGGGKVEEG
jgi:hypothetical protein